VEGPLSAGIPCGLSVPADSLLGFEGTESLCGGRPAEADGRCDVAGAQTSGGRAKEVEDVLQSARQSLRLAGVQPGKGGQDQTDASAAWRLAEECGASAGLGPVQCGLKPRSARCWHEKR
jgi:hypothetical protein